MAKFEILMPALGEGITEATLTKWLKKPGDKVAEEESVAEIATDKVDSEIPSPVAGIVKELLFEEGAVVEIGKAIAVLQTESEETAVQEEVETKRPEQNTGEKAPPQPDPQPLDIAPQTLAKGSQSDRFYSPLVRSIAQKENISPQELDRIPGSGKDGRVTRDDMLAYLDQRTVTPDKGIKEPLPAQSSAPLQQPALSASGDEIIEMTRMRKLIADHMINSRDTSVHVTSVIEADVTNLVKWREKHKKAFEQREGEKLTFTPLFVWAIAKTLRDFPLINSSISGHNIVVKKNINIGMAAALPDGNLIVPVIKNADHKSLLGLTKSVNDLANRARINKLLPDEIQGGTFTLTNLGTFNNIFGTPIINQPQVAILATGAIRKKPVVLETEHGDTIAIRHMMYISMSYDHRIIDGALGGMALKRMGEYLQNWKMDTSI